MPGLVGRNKNLSSKKKLSRHKTLDSRSALSSGRNETITLALNDGFALLKKRVEELLGNDNHEKQVPEEIQRKDIESLSKATDSERFFFVINLLDVKTEHILGVQQWLGYPDKEWNLRMFYRSIHPAHVLVSTLHVYHSLGLLLQGDIKVSYMLTRYASTIALRHRDGHYLLCKRLVSAFQYDSKNRLLEYLNEFTIIGEFRNEPYTFRTSDLKGNQYAWERMIADKIKKEFESQQLFSQQEMRVIQEYAYEPDTHPEKICRKFRITRNTLNTYHRRIAAKMLNIFSIKFPTVRDAAQFIRAEGLI